MPGLDSRALGTMQMVGAGYAEEARAAAVPSLLPLPGFGHNDVPAVTRSSRSAHRWWSGGRWGPSWGGWPSGWGPASRRSGCRDVYCGWGRMRMEAPGDLQNVRNLGSRGEFPTKCMWGMQSV